VKFNRLLNWGQHAQSRRAPLALTTLLLLVLALKIVAAIDRVPWQASAEQLPLPSAQLLTMAGGGDQIMVARMVTLWLQTFDSQPGLSLAYHQLDYQRVAAWLEQILRLDPRGQYPLLLASRIYGEVNDPVRQRVMADLVYRLYFADPGRRWRWLVHTISVTRHQLGDLPRALKYAHALRNADPALPIPGWARQMEIFLREDMGESEAAAVMLGALLESGVVHDPAELRFLLQRLEALQTQ